MLGQPTSMLIPPVVGLRLSGATKRGRDRHRRRAHHHRTAAQARAWSASSSRPTAPGVASLSLETRATIGNMSPEYGATCAIFPIDQVTLDYLAFTGRPAEQLALVEAYAKAQGIWHDAEAPRAHLLRVRRARPLERRAQPRRTQASPGPRVALGRARRVSRRPRARAQGSAWATGRRRAPARRRRRPSRPSRRAPTPRTLRCSSPRAWSPRPPSSAASRAKPWVKTSLAPGQSRRHGLPRTRRTSSTPSTSWASTSPATDAPRASATPVPCSTASPTR